MSFVDTLRDDREIYEDLEKNMIYFRIPFYVSS